MNMLIQHIRREVEIVKRRRNPDSRSGAFIETVEMRNMKVATFIGICENGVIKTGWSKVNLKKGDAFNAQTGVAFAMLNLVMNNSIPIPLKRTLHDGRVTYSFNDLPDWETGMCIWQEYVVFQERCKKYFKQAQKDAGEQALVDQKVQQLEALFAQNGVNVGGDEIRNFVIHGLPLATELYSMGIKGIGFQPSGNPILVRSNADVPAL